MSDCQKTQRKDGLNFFFYEIEKEVKVVVVLLLFILSSILTVIANVQVDEKISKNNSWTFFKFKENWALTFLSKEDKSKIDLEKIWQFDIKLMIFYNQHSPGHNTF